MSGFAHGNPLLVMPNGSQSRPTASPSLDRKSSTESPPQRPARWHNRDGVRGANGLPVPHEHGRVPGVACRFWSEASGGVGRNRGRRCVLVLVRGIRRWAQPCQALRAKRSGARVLRDRREIPNRRACRGDCAGTCALSSEIPTRPRAAGSIAQLAVCIAHKAARRVGAAPTGAGVTSAHERARQCDATSISTRRTDP